MRTHFHRPDPRTGANVENPLGVLYRCEEQPTIVHKLKHMMLHIQSVKFLLIVWIDVGYRCSVSLTVFHWLDIEVRMPTTLMILMVSSSMFNGIIRHTSRQRLCVTAIQNQPRSKLTTRLALMQKASRANETEDNKVPGEGKLDGNKRIEREKKEEIKTYKSCPVGCWNILSISTARPGMLSSGNTVDTVPKRKKKKTKKSEENQCR